MASRTSTKFGAAIARAARAPAHPSATPSKPKPTVIKQELSPSSSELSSPPPTDDEKPKYSSKHFPPVKIEALPEIPFSESKKRRQIKQEPSDDDASEPPPTMGDIPKLKKHLPPPKIKKQKKELSTTPPQNWEEMYNLTKKMRLARPAPVDTMGCDVAADKTLSPLVQRFQTLVSLMLSSQTKDTVNAATMAKLRGQLPGGLTLESILAVEPAELNTLIAAVGFHRRKTEYIKNAAVILRDQWGGDIPDSIEGLISLPGVGPKMAHLCMSAAWDRTMGIGVDVHVHRIANLWGWVESTTPERTREQLEAWLPRDKWREINWLLVGFGQTTCLPRGRKCGECLLSKGLCRAAFKGDTAAKRKNVKVESEDEEDGEGVKADPDADFKGEGNVDGRVSPAKSPRKRLRRRLVKVQVKTEDAWMSDIEDAGSD